MQPQGFPGRNCKGFAFVVLSNSFGSEHLCCVPRRPTRRELLQMLSQRTEAFALCAQEALPPGTPSRRELGEDRCFFVFPLHLCDKSILFRPRCVLFVFNRTLSKKRSFSIVLKTVVTEGRPVGVLTLAKDISVKCARPRGVPGFLFPISVPDFSSAVWGHSPGSSLT